MRGGRRAAVGIRRGVAAAMLAAAIGFAAPASAQFSAGYKFLDAVKKKDGTAVEAALSEPGSTIVNTRDVSTGETALHIVTAARDITWMTYLLQKGANVNARTVRGITPLQTAVSLGFTQGVALLVRYQADVNLGDDTGETPLISAVHRRDLEMARALLAGGADPDRPDNSGRSAREYAKLGGDGQLQSVLAAAAKASPRPDPAKVYGP